MSLFVYITEACRSDARRYALNDTLDRFKERVEASQSTNQFDPFPPPYLVKKKLGGRQGRLIADLRKIGEHAVVVFLAIMIRGDRAYEDHFSKDPVGYGQQHFGDLVSAQELSDYIQERTKVEPPPAKSPPNEAEFSFLYDALAQRQTAQSEDMVYETIEWKEAVAQDRVANQLVRFADPCLRALSKEQGLHYLEIEGKPGWGLWAYRSPHKLLLITPQTDATKANADRIVDGYRKSLEGGDFSHMLRASRRAYPAYMLADEDTWVEIEKEPVANMALSPEESEVLLSARQSEGAFPMFINGRAGSGKSTILQYLFADLLYYYLTTATAQLTAPPVYLTANGELLRVARSFVERMLRNEASFLENGSQDILKNSREVLDEAFREFQPHLLSLVESRARVERFPLLRRIDYSRFRKLWVDWFGMDRGAVKEFGPDISWHVIRSYIKGMSSETYMDPDDYAQLPENQLTVRRSTFEAVFTRVWEGRYAKLAEAEGLWDDQDLARFVLDEGLVKPTHPAILCDEAQDFTRIELELLLRLNLYSERAVPPHALCRVPFAFAGDQFQTLNPTGFRWDAIKASFVEKFIHALDPAGRSGRTDLNYRELHYNYRSTAPIVRFCNGVQALRAAFFKIPDLRPQTPWALSSAAFPVVWFDAQDVTFWRKFKEADSFVVIVPCNEGEEAQFVQEDPVLRQYVRMDEGVPQNVLSAARAKGREYQVVVVYGFGAKCPVDVDVTGICESSVEDTLDASLPLQYFINRLYVAVSRPKLRLIVVDTEAGINGLWQFATREEVGRNVLKKANRGRRIWDADPEDSKFPAVEGMTLGKAELLTRESSGDPSENARAFEEDGRARRDPFLLRQAALAYRSVGELGKASECRGRALDLEGKYFEAAQAYEECGLFVPEAVRAYWKDGKRGWSHLCDLGRRNAMVGRETEFKLALVLSNGPGDSRTGVELVREIHARVADSAFAAYVASEPTWKDAVGTLVGMTCASISTPEAIQMVELLERLEAVGIAQEHKRMAEVYFISGDLTRAVERWEKSGDTKADNYLRAKAEIDPYPAKLLSLSRVGAVESLLREFESHREVPLDAAQWSVVAGAFLAKDRLSEGLDCAWKGLDTVKLQKVIVKAVGVRNAALAVTALHAAVFALVGNSQWDTLAKFASTLELSPDPTWLDDGIREIVEGNAEELQCTLVRALSRAPHFPDLPGHLLRQFTEFFRRFLRVKDGKWRANVSVIEAGAAIERGGRITDALSFYEALGRDGALSESEKRFSQERWLVCKGRHLEYEREQGSQSKRVKEIEREIAEVSGRLGIKRLADLPRYPVLPVVDRPFESGRQVDAGEEAAKSGDLENSGGDVGGVLYEKVASDLPDRVSAQLGDIGITFSRRLARCNFQHGPSMRTGYLNISTGEFGGECAWTKTSGSEWVCEEWKLRVVSREGRLFLVFTECGVRVVIDQADGGSA